MTPEINAISTILLLVSILFVSVSFSSRADAQVN